MKLAIVTLTAADDELLKIAAELGRQHFVTVWQPESSSADGKATRGSGSRSDSDQVFPLPQTITLTQAALHTYDLTIYWLDTLVEDSPAGFRLLNLVPGIIVLAPGVEPPTQIPVALAQTLAESYGVVTADQQIGTFVDGLTLGNVIGTDNKETNSTTPITIAETINQAAELALARKPYVQLAQDLAIRLSQANLTNDDEIIEKVTNYAFQLFDLA